MDPEIKAKLADWQRRATAGEPISLDEMKQAIILLRSGRSAAITAASASKSRTKKAPARSADDLLSEFGDSP